MSIEDINQIQPMQNDIFGDYGLNGVSLQSNQDVNTYHQKYSSSKNSYETLILGSNQNYYIPLNSVRNESIETLRGLRDFISDVDYILDQVRIDPDTSPTLQETHRHIWSEINSEKFEGYTIPNFVSYQEFIYAEQHQCRGCRRFVKEYNKLISTTTFGHIFIFRKIALALLNEASCIASSLEGDFDSDYENDSQQKIATHYVYWLKMATHYKKLFEKTIPSKPTLLPESEVDQIDKRQAAQFQAFFSIRINSETVNIDNQLHSLTKDLVDDCNIFYDQFISPAIKLKSKVIEDLSLDIRTTNMIGSLPRLAEEAITAVLTVEGNFKSVLTDMLERKNLMIKKIDSIYQSVLSRRKYVLYVSQLASKALSKNKIVTENYDPIYVEQIKNAIINRDEKVNSYTSSHSSFSNLNEDSHPQYLLKSGGVITGNISVEQDVTIDGVQISSHAHDGTDGTVRIKSIDIDYDSVRELNKQVPILDIKNDLTVTIDSFDTDVLPGGTPVANAIVSIELPDYLKDRYDFEIQYLEM